MEFKKFIESSYNHLDYKEYQAEGVRWCIEREKIEDGEKIEGTQDYCCGGIIADEMGLGKTIMMIGTILENFKMPTLIILPVFLIDQWYQHIYRATGHKALVYHGQIKKVLDKEMLKKIPIILTTYGTILSDARNNRIIQEIYWERVICDEAHHMRNRRAQITNAVTSLNRKITWLISGTPIQNHINDLYSLLEILKIPKNVFIKTDNLKDIMSKVLLKRTKKEVGLKLPPLQINRITTEWSNPVEQKLSEDIHDKLSFSLLKQKPIEKGMVLAMMTFARMICVYPPLAAKHIENMKEMGYVSKENMDGTNYSSKMNKVIETLVSRKDNGNRKIVFTTFKEEIDYLRNQLINYGIKTDFIDGRISKGQRNAILKSDVDVLILQIKTGNEGLNLQEYSEVYFVTPNWNPKVEEQAIARCHRLGQTKKVNVFRFVMNSFDDQLKTQNIEMYSEFVQNEKRDMESSIVK